MAKRLLTEICSALLVLLFTYAALSKLVDYPLFQHDMHNQPFPSWLASLLIFIVPATELVAAVMLAARKFRNTGLILSVAIMGLFTLYTVLILSFAFGHIPCSCGGVIRNLTWRQHLWFNVFFLVVAIAGLYFHQQLNKKFYCNKAGAAENLSTE